jgi:RHS repeat-associated protein
MKNSRIVKLIGIGLLVIGLFEGVFGQQRTSRPERGTEGKASDAQSEIDSVNLQNGNVSLNIPLASLPPIAGGKLSASISAYYNSKLYNAQSKEKQGFTTVPGCQPSHSTSELRVADSGGGWKIGGGYVLFFRDAHEDYDYLLASSEACFGYEFYHMAYRFFKPMLRSPDGSEHELRILGNFNTYTGDKEFLKSYYRHSGSGPIPTFSSPTELFSVDGTYLKVVVNPPSSSTLWTAYMKDGTQVIQLADSQRIKDMNGNSILSGYANGNYFVRDEQTGREIKTTSAVINGQSVTQVQYQKVGGAWENMSLVWGSTTVQGKTYKMEEWDTDGGSELPTCNISKEFQTDLAVIREIILPATEQNGQQRKYSFAYNSDTTVQTTLVSPRWNCSNYQVFPDYTRTASLGMGEISQITSPTGAVYKYHYTADGKHDLGLFLDGAAEVSRNIITSKELIHDGMTDSWIYDIDVSGQASAGVVTNPDGSQYAEKFYPIGTGTGTSGSGIGGLTYRSWQSGKVMTERHWTLLGGALVAFGSTGGNNVTFNPVVDTEYTSLLDSDGNRIKMSAKKFQYDYNGDLIQTTEYDWFDPSLVTFTTSFEHIPVDVPPSATVLRVTNNGYYNQAANSFSATAYHRRAVGNSPVILGLLQESTVGTSQTRISYDGLSYGTPPTKGNATKVSAWDNSNNQWIETSSGYDSYGNVISKTDAKGNVSQIFYEDLTHALPTKTIVDPQNGTGQQITMATYDFYTGLPVTSTDINGNVSSIDYTNLLLGAVDPFGRVGTSYSPYINIDGVNKRLTSKTYYEDSTRKVRTESDLNNEGDAIIKGRSTSDQLGRPILSEKNENGANSYTISSQTIYKPNDRVVMSSNPTKSIGEATDGWTRVTSDILGRPIETATFSGSAPPPIVSGITASNFTGRVLTDYSANTTTVTDQAGKQRRSIVNAIGQLTRIDEPDNNGNLGTAASPIQPTIYVYDVLGNLITVNQGVQTRTFEYDSLSRLKSANIPESGLISYTYDVNSNLKTKRDARGIKTIYDYDNFNRVLKRCYRVIGTGAIGLTTCTANNEPIEPNTPEVSYTYDNLTNAKGKLTKVTNGISTTEYTNFDLLGRVKNHSQTTDGNTYNSSYVYNLSGALIEETYPSGRVVKNTLDQDGDLQQVQSRKSSGTFKNYANAFTYTSAGAVSSMRLGNGKFENTTFNSRLQPIQIGLGSSATSQNLLKLNFDYGGIDNNGNVKSQQIAVPTVGTNQGFVATQVYSYDSLNRLKSAVETIPNQTGWKQTFIFDRYGNRTFDTTSNNTTTLANGCPVAICNPTANPQDNKLVGTNYDSVGNTSQDANGQIFIYDAENKQTKVVNSQGIIIGEYFYDGDGKRIKKFVPSTNETTVFVYDTSDKVVAEYSTVAASQLEAKVSYLTSDHLGSPRINTDANGKVIARHDFRPYGEEISRVSYSSDAIRQKFTTYQRDGETELDYAQARFYSSKLGRFYSVDPENAGAMEGEPQSWNAYSYALNNPLKYGDPSGLGVEVCSVSGERTCVNYTEKEWKTFLKSNTDGAYKIDGTGIYWNGELTGRITDSSMLDDRQQGFFNEAADQSERKGIVVGGLVAITAAATACIATGTCAAAIPAVRKAAQVILARLAAKQAVRSAVRAVMRDPNKVRHIFGNAGHKLGNLVNQLGGKEKTLEAVFKALDGKLPSSGGFIEKIVINGTSVEVRGAVVNGITRIGTMFVP